MIIWTHTQKKNIHKVKKINETKEVKKERERKKKVEPENLQFCLTKLFMGYAWCLWLDLVPDAFMRHINVFDGSLNFLLLLLLFVVGISRLIWSNYKEILHYALQFFLPSSSFSVFVRRFFFLFSRAQPKITFLLFLMYFSFILCNNIFFFFHFHLAVGCC